MPRQVTAIENVENIMSRPSLTPIALAAWMILAAWPANLDAADKKKPAAPEAPLVWPLPPDPPRIRFVTAYRSVDDFKQKSGSKCAFSWSLADELNSEQREINVLQLPVVRIICRWRQ